MKSKQTIRNWHLFINICSTRFSLQPLRLVTLWTEWRTEYSMLPWRLYILKVFQKLGNIVAKVAIIAASVRNIWKWFRQPRRPRRQVEAGVRLAGNGRRWSGQVLPIIVQSLNNFSLEFCRISCTGSDICRRLEKRWTEWLIICDFLTGTATTPSRVWKIYREKFYDI